MSYPVIDPIILTPTVANATTYVVTIAAQNLTLVDDDYVLLYVHTHATTGALSIAGSGWAELVELDITSGGQMAVYACKVASGVVADPTITATVTTTWQVVLEQWRDVATGAAVSDGFEIPTPTQANAVSVASPTFTPAAADGTIVYFGAVRGNTGQHCRFLSDKVVAAANPQVDISTSSFAMAIGTVQQSAAAATAETMYAAESARLGCITFAVKNKTGGKLSRDSRASMTKVAWMGNYGTAHESLGSLTFNAPSTFCVWNAGTEQLAGINLATVLTGITTTHNTLGLPPINGRYTDMASAVNVASEWNGIWWATPTTLDMTGKIFTVEWFMAQFGGDLLGAQGVVIAFGDDAAADTGNAVVFQLAPKLAIQAITLLTSHIAVETATQFAAVGSINWATIKKIGIFYHRTGSSTASRSVSWRNMFLHGNTIMTGGNATRPLNGQFLHNVLNGWGYTNLCTKSGDAMLAKTSLQFGDGSKPTYVDTTATLLNTPAKYNTGSQPFWNVPPNTVTVGVKAASGDTIKLIASAFAAGPGAEQNFTIDPATSALATLISTQGGVFGNWLWTGDTDFDPTGATYSGCDEVAWKGATVTSCTVSATTSTDAAASVDANTTITSTTIDGTGALYALELGAAVTAVTLADGTLTAGTTDKVHVKATTGTVTITISGTTSLIAADVTTDGATVSIVAPQPTLLATVLASSRVVLYNNTTAAELDNTAPAGTSWSKVITSGASANDSLTLYVFKEGYQEFSTTFLYTGDDATILVTQAVDSNIASLRTELSITDYTTITEFALDITGTVEIDADDADGSTLKARLVIWYNGVLTTEDGARYLRGAITILSTAAFRINVDVIDLQVTNISATFGLQFTDTERRLYRSDGTPIYSSTSVAGSIQNDYSGVPDTVETGVSGLTGAESAQLMALPSATTTATAVLSAASTTPIHADIRKVNSYTVDGVGSDADPWGPV